MIASIVIPTYRNHDALIRVLTAVCLQEFPSDEYEIVVADDAACDATRELVESMAASSRCAVRYVPVLAKHGLAAARNCGWREACGDVLAFTDDNCIPDPLWLANGVRALRKQAALDAVWGKLVVPLPSKPTHYELEASGQAHATFVSANCFVKRQAMAIVGGFDERFRGAWREDTDLYFRLLKHSMRVEHVPSAVVVHPLQPGHWGASLAQQAKRQFDVLLYRKHPQLYRQHIAPFPFLYVAIVCCGVGSILASLLGAADVSLLFGVLWVAFTIRFTCQRLIGTSREPRHLMEMLVTSIAIPWLAIYYRAVGWCCLRSA